MMKKTGKRFKIRNNAEKEEGKVKRWEKEFINVKLVNKVKNVKV
jgi:hypothetical protein